MADEKDVPYRSTAPGACHACGHDVHTSILLGTGLFLARAAAGGALPGKVRLIFQPAEESIPSSVPDVIAAGALVAIAVWWFRRRKRPAPEDVPSPGNP